MFRDRTGAGCVLATALAERVSGPVVVAGIPRGGLQVARPVAARLRARLGVVYVQKLTSPLSPEFAFGALDDEGQVVIDKAAVAALGLGEEQVDGSRARVAREICERRRLYGIPPLVDHLAGRAVVLVDDGLATGLTMETAVAQARRHGARAVIVAAPCASSAADGRLRRLADDVVCLVVDGDFASVAQYYLDFSAVTDAEVIALLAGAGAHLPPAVPPEPETRTIAIGTGGRS